MSDKVEGGTIIVGNYEVAMQMSAQRTIKITGYIYANEDNAAVNARLDAAQDALDRQYVRTDIVVKEAMIEAKLAGLMDAQDHFSAVVEKKNARERGEKVQISTGEKQVLERYEQQVRGTNIEIAAMRAAIAKAKKKLNGAAA